MILYCAYQCFTLTNLPCIPLHHLATSHSDNNTVNLGLAVGLSMGLILCMALPICIGVAIYCKAKRRKRNVRTLVIATAPSSGPTLVTSTRETSFTTTPTAYCTQPSPTQFTPPPYSTQPQPVYKDAQLSSGEAPPSYEDALAYPLASVCYTSVVVIFHYNFFHWLLYRTLRPHRQNEQLLNELLNN